MTTIILKLDSAKDAYRILHSEQYPDSDLDHIASSVIAKKYDSLIEEELDKWLHIDEDKYVDHLKDLMDYHRDEPDLMAIHRLLYEIHNDFGHLGLIIRLALLDGNGNLFIQVEELNNVSYRFHVYPKDGII